MTAVPVCITPPPPPWVLYPSDALRLEQANRDPSVYVCTVIVLVVQSIDVDAAILIPWERNVYFYGLNWISGTLINNNLMTCQA